MELTPQEVGHKREVVMAFVLTEESLEADVAVSPDSVATPRPAERSDASWRLELLQALHAKSLVSDEEFEAKRTKISNLQSPVFGDRDAVTLRRSTSSGSNWAPHFARKICRREI